MLADSYSSSLTPAHLAHHFTTSKRPSPSFASCRTCSLSSILPSVHPPVSFRPLLTLLSVMTASWFTPVMLNVSPLSPSRMVYSSLAFSPRSASDAEIRPISAPGMASSETEKDHMPERERDTMAHMIISLVLRHYICQLMISFCLVKYFHTAPRHLCQFNIYYISLSDKAPFHLGELRGRSNEIKEEKGVVSVCDTEILLKVR